ncbi:RNA-binding protein [Schizosaccharomyces octosporus yFS286]|uniref:RNA-binding protein n=1 Tax=Schizosaccharomyces octosporus (strain yFS286) TaxID=483514 RepID=S9RKV6_SCHOY|nr:RNA-binding protein [Schizosaccharomyces octosporus yFS286]EPX74574.1 RNA-binding protein [Schizosaccharomyces octosporus yFS286]
MSFSLYDGLDSKTLDEIAEESAKAKEKEKSSEHLYETSPPSNSVESKSSSSKTTQTLSSLHFLPMVRRNKPNKKKNVNRLLNKAVPSSLTVLDNVHDIPSNDTSSINEATSFNISNESTEKKRPSSGLNHDTLVSSFKVEKLWSELYNPLNPTSYDIYKKSEYGKAVEHEWDLYVSQNPSLATEARNAGLAQSSQFGIGPPPALLKDTTINSIYSNASVPKSDQIPDSLIESPKYKPTKNYGKILLKKFGWNEGQGLGLSNQGIINPLQTKPSNGFDGVKGFKDGN